MITGKQIRQRLAGQSLDNVLVSENGFKLIHKIDYRGWFDEAFHVENFWITREDKFVGAYPTLNEALQAWDIAWSVENSL